MKPLGICLCAAALSGCVASIAETRSEGPPRSVVQAADFDRAVACIADQIASKHDMDYLPSADGGTFYVSYPITMAGTSSILIEAKRGDPSTIKTYFTGGPWLGRDDSIVDSVETCARTSG